MYNGTFLQSYVCPIWSCERHENGVDAKKFHGTGFFVGTDGVFITATHVIQEASNYVSENGGVIAASPRQIVNGMETDLFIELDEISSADAPFDISIATTGYSVEPKYYLRDRSQTIGDDITALGYPVSNTNKVEDNFLIQARMHKGYIQRIIPPNRLWPGQRDTPNIFETNFPITHGMSGSPLITNRIGKEFVIGVCVASYSSRIVEYQNTVFKEGEEEFREEVSKVEEFGIVHDLRPLFNWQPKCLGGRRFREIVS